MYQTKIISVEKMRELEDRANAKGLSYSEMMENAGRATADAIGRRLGAKDKRVIILIGPGNNGGDGLVAAHYLKQMGARVKCYLWNRNTENDANFQRVERDALPVVWAVDDAGFAGLRSLVASADVVVDALLGVGVSRPLSGSLKELLDAVREALGGEGSLGRLAYTVPSRASNPGALVVAVDCPTGLDCDTGALDPAALHAGLTVTFAYPKTGLYRLPGAEAVGDLVVVDIGIPQSLTEDVALELAMPETIRGWLPPRPFSAHKGTFGRALVVAGSVNYVGAAVLAGAGATRVGTGLVTMGLPMPIQPPVAAHLTEATYLLLPHDLGVINRPAARAKWGSWPAPRRRIGTQQSSPHSWWTPTGSTRLPSPKSGGRLCHRIRF
jgi:NAD(P)H-hydrate epimerase